MAYSAASYAGYLSLIACAGSLLMAAGSFASSQKRLRQLFIAGSGTWLLHNIIALTPMGISLELLFISSNLIAYYRYELQRSRYSMR